MVEGVNALFEPSPTPRCAPSGSCAKATCCWMQWFAWPTMATSTISLSLHCFFDEVSGLMAETLWVL